MVQHQWDSQKKDGLLNQDVTLRFNVGKFLNVLLIMALLVGVFYLGRLTGGSTTVADVDTAEAGVAEVESVDEKSADDGPGFFQRLFANDDGEEDEQPVATTSPILDNNTNQTPAVVPDPVPIPVVAAPTVPANQTEASTAPPTPVPETVITEYPTGTLAMTLTGVKREWFETWGKINTLEVTFRNNAQGTIKPSYITMVVEGYDYDKRVPLAVDSSISIKAGQTKNLFVTVPGGWAYNRVTAGDLKSVTVTIVLFDEADKQMGSDRKEMSLEG